MNKLLCLVLLFFSTNFLSVSAEIAENILTLPDIHEQLYKAVEKESINEVKELLKQGADPDSIYVNEEEYTYFNSLHAAVSQKNYELTKLLLEHGADPNKTTGYYEKTPLVLATENRDIKITELLLKHKADPDIGWSMRECLSGRPEHPYETPLYNAISSDDLELVELLLRYKADPHCGHAGQVDGIRGAIVSLLEMACRNGNIPIVKALLNAFSLDNQNDRDVLASSLKAICDQKLNDKNKDITPVLTALLDKIGDPQKVDLPLLILAVRLGDHSLVSMLLEKQCDLNIPDKEGNCALHYAVFNGNLGITQLLLERKADPNKRTSDRGCGSCMSPLDIAIQDSLEDNYHITANRYRKSLPRAQIVELLLKNGADPNSFTERDFSQITSLHRAITNNDLALVKILLKYKADPNIRTRVDKYTPLQLAALRADPAVAEVLLAHGAHINNVAGEDDVTAAELAASRGRITMLKYLLKKGAQLDEKALKRILTNVCSYAHTGVLKVLLENLPLEKLLFKDEQGCTLLHLAVDNDRNKYYDGYSRNDAVKAIELLLDKGLPVNEQENNGNTALHYLFFEYPSIQACNSYNDREAVGGKILKLLIQHKANINLRNKDGCLPLHLALKSEFDRKYPELVTLLIDQDTPLESKDTDGNTPLLYAQTDSSLKLLLDKGVDISVKNNDNETVLHKAARCPTISADVFKLVLDNKALLNESDNRGNTPLLRALEYPYGDHANNRAKAQLLIEHDADVRLANSEYAPIHKASLYSVDLVRAVLDKSADVNQKDSAGNTPLFWAVKNSDSYVDGVYSSCTAIVELLLAKGASLNHQNTNGETVLMYCVDNGSAKMMKFLLAKGADTKLKNKNGRTALHLAADSWDDKKVRVLLERDKSIINEPDVHGKTALELARYDNIKKVLIQVGASENTVKAK